MTKEKITTLSELEEGTPTEFTIDGSPLVLVRSNGSVTALEAHCTHKGVPFAGKAHVKDGMITCGAHGACFNVKNGEVVDVPFPEEYGKVEPLKTYSVHVEGEEVLVEIKRHRLRKMAQSKQE